MLALPELCSSRQAARALVSSLSSTTALDWRSRSLAGGASNATCTGAGELVTGTRLLASFCTTTTRASALLPLMGVTTTQAGVAQEVSMCSHALETF